MEQNTPKFRLRLNLFDTIVLVLALAVGAFLLWRAVKPAGTSEIIQPGDRIADNIKNYEVGHVVSAQAVPALVQTPDRESRRWVWAELEGFEDVLVTVEAPCTVSDKAFTVGGGYEVRVGTIGFLRGEGYMGSGPIVAVEEVQG